jgi:ribosomal protein L11 methyltransferase
LEENFDIVIANILTNPLCVLAPLLVLRISLGGRIALSGVLTAQAEHVIAAYAPFMALRVGAEREGWVRLEGQQQGQRSASRGNRFACPEFPFGGGQC